MQKIILSLFAILILGSVDMYGFDQTQPNIYVPHKAEILMFRAIVGNVVGVRVLLERGLSAEDCQEALDWANECGSLAVSQVMAAAFALE